MTHQVIAQSTQIKYIANLSNASGHHWQADEPKKVGGGNTAPNPMELLLSALGACTVITLQMYAERKGWQLKEVNIELEFALEAAQSGKNHINRVIRLTGELDGAQKERLLKVAEACPVHKLLIGAIEISTSLGN